MARARQLFQVLWHHDAHISLSIILLRPERAIWPQNRQVRVDRSPLDGRTNAKIVDIMGNAYRALLVALRTTADICEDIQTYSNLARMGAKRTCARKSRDSVDREAAPWPSVKISLVLRCFSLLPGVVRCVPGAVL